MMKSILVTGASGFVGRRLVGALKSSGYQVTELNDGDIADSVTLKPFESLTIDFV